MRSFVAMIALAIMCAGCSNSLTPHARDGDELACWVALGEDALTVTYRNQSNRPLLVIVPADSAPLPHTYLRSDSTLVASFAINARPSGMRAEFEPIPVAKYLAPREQQSYSVPLSVLKEERWQYRSRDEPVAALREVKRVVVMTGFFRVLVIPPDAEAPVDLGGVFRAGIPFVVDRERVTAARITADEDFEACDPRYVDLQYLCVSNTVEASFALVDSELIRELSP